MGLYNVLSRISCRIDFLQLYTHVCCVLICFDFAPTHCCTGLTVASHYPLGACPSTIINRHQQPPITSGSRGPAARAGVQLGYTQELLLHAASNQNPSQKTPTTWQNAETSPDPFLVIPPLPLRPGLRLSGLRLSGCAYPPPVTGSCGCCGRTTHGYDTYDT